MSSCSPGCACTVSLRGTELDPGPVTMGSAGTSHDGSPGKVQGRQGNVVQGSALWCARQWWTPTRRGACEAMLGGQGGGSGKYYSAGKKLIGSGRLVRAAAVQGKN